MYHPARRRDVRGSIQLRLKRAARRAGATSPALMSVIQREAAERRQSAAAHTTSLAGSSRWEPRYSRSAALACSAAPRPADSIPADRLGMNHSACAVSRSMYHEARRRDVRGNLQQKDKEPRAVSHTQVSRLRSNFNPSSRTPGITRRAFNAASAKSCG
jgi:hypothetical protein